ncbi:sensor histidine kinase [Algoriphagus namhaensis]
MEGLVNFLEQTNYNGFGFSILSILLYLFIYHFILFVKTKEKFYLFYSAYAFVNTVILIPIPYNVFSQDIFQALPQFFIVLDSPLKFASYMLFSYFVIEVLHLRKHKPAFVRFFDYFFLAGLLIYLVLGTLEIFYPEYSWMHYFFYRIFLPIYFLLMLYGSYLIYRTDESIKNYILTGSLILGLSAMLAAVLTTGQNSEVIDRVFYVYYIGVLLENLLFTYSLAVKQREIYANNLRFQEKLVDQYKENQELREQLNERLKSELVQKEKELISLAADAEDERMERVKVHFEKEITRLHLLSLRSQMNPHFIFNALNSIKVFLIDKDKDRAILYLNRFSKLIRMVLESSKKTKISLEEELEMAKLYLTLESIRFEGGIDLLMDIPEDVNLTDFQFPPLVLQPFFENAIWHGLMNQKGRKWIKVAMKPTETGYRMSIRDNGIGRKSAAEINAKRTMKKESLGMSLSQDRLALFNQSESLHYHFEIIDHEDKDDSGTEVIFWI